MYQTGYENLQHEQLRLHDVDANRIVNGDLRELLPSTSTSPSALTLLLSMFMITHLIQRLQHQEQLFDYNCKLILAVTYKIGYTGTD